jgi:hypothetical protein
MTNGERLKIAFANIEKGKRFKTKEIKDLLISTFPNDKFSRDSILPSDYCYNLHNSGLPDNIDDQYIVFKQVDHGNYVYLGEHAEITCEITHNPKKGIPYPYGEWKNGIRRIYENSSMK